jgi:pyrimidine nucleoside transport protein
MFLFQATVGTTACESMIAAGNVFLGLAEAPLVIRPYIRNLTPSELHSVMTSGFSTVAGGILAALIAVDVSATHLLSASLMSAPASLACAKLLYPGSKTFYRNCYTDYLGIGLIFSDRGYDIFELFYTV